MEYTSQEITVEKKLFKDLRIYGDDIEELIYELSNELDFNVVVFWDSFIEYGFYSPSEIYLNLPKFFYIDLKELFFYFRIVYRTPIEMGNDILVKELIELITQQMK